MTDVSHNEIRAQLEAYALGALDDDERDAVEAHLADCADCRLVAEQAADAASALPSALAAASPLELPPSLKGRVLARVERDGGAPQRRPWWRRPRAALALAALVLAALFVAWNARLEDARSEEKDLRARLALLQDLQPVVLEVIDSRQTVKRVLLPPENQPESRAYGKVFTRTDLSDVVTMVNRLPRPPEGRVYRLWLTAAGRTRSAGVMSVDEHGFALLVFKAAGKNPAYDDARVVLQPKDAKSPTGVTMVLWNMRS
jgi:hypothetical protein